MKIPDLRGTSEPLKAVEPLIHRSFGARAEGDVAAVLKQSPYMIRSFEFGLADMAIDCTAEYSPTQSWADRLWNVDQRQYDPSKASEIGLIDIKSSLIAAAEIFANETQRQRVAVFICVCTGDPAYVDVLPNFHQSAAAMKEDDGVQRWEDQEKGEQRLLSITRAKVSRLPQSAYGLVNPSHSPYRMPLSLLLEAIARIRAHMRGEAVYVNPHTGVGFEQWKPLTCRHTEWLKPSRISQRSACEAVFKIYQALRWRGSEKDMLVDFVGLQPRLADFKIILRGKQWMVQHKFESQPLNPRSPLDKIKIARGDPPKRSYYFNAHNRFDFFFYQMEFSQQPLPGTRFECFFLPEQVIPDDFYTTLLSETSFEIPAFMRCALADWEGRKGFRIHMDEDGRWVDHIRAIIEAYPQPRKPGERPSRNLGTILLEDDENEEVNEDEDEDEEPSGLTISSIEEMNDKAQHGRQGYVRIMTAFHRRFFYKILAQCARRGRGVLVAFAPNHPLGDFGYCDAYTWTESETMLFKQQFWPPQFSHTLPENVELVPICCYTRHNECSHQGPDVSAPEFRRLNSCVEGRLIIWDFGGQDTGDDAIPPAVIPSEDLTASPAQRALFSANLGLKGNQWKAATPSLSALLRSGLQASEYAVGTQGPFGFKTFSWSDLWELLHSFGSADSVQHPMGYQRQPATYRHSLQVFHERLSYEQYTRGIYQDERDEQDDHLEDAP